jgi:[protein-PII] uridylyltransferase
VSELTAHRLGLAGTRGFAAAGAGPARRAALTRFGRDWVAQRWADATDGREPAGVALAAVGSLARGDAGPLSDYDLVLVHEGRSMGAAELERLADRLWYPMWDAGLKIDHSVRTTGQCRDVAGKDLSAAIGLLDLSHLAGAAEVVEVTRTTVAHDWRANARKRLPELLDEVRARHARIGDAAHLLEPDLKEARGGLRDLTVLRSMAAAWLADRPHGEVDAAYQQLLDVRDAVHVVTGRGRDRLGREDHDAVAALLGFDERDQMLVQVSCAARVIAYALDGTLRRAGQAQRARILRVGPRRPTLEPLGFGLFRHDGEVVLGAGVHPQTDPTLPLRAAAVAARHELPLAPATLANLAANCPALPQPWPQEALALFGDLLAAGPGLVTVWEGLDLAGLVTRWIPEWAAVRSRPQHNPVHRHTVDRHSIETVVSAARLVRDVQRADLLLLAALLHDVGKVDGALEHAAVGAPVADRVLARMGLPKTDRETVVHLVREHLTLVDLATRRDPTDPATLAALSDAVDGSVQTLALLRALTEADATAAGPAAWTDWRRTLVDRLTDAARRHLDNRPGPVEGDLAEGDLVEGDLLPAPGEELPAPGEDRAVPTPERALDPRLVARVREGQPVVRVEATGAAYRLLVLDRDRVGLFADVAGLLAADGLLVRSAILRTVDGVAIDEWQVEAPRGEAPEPGRLARSLVRLAAGDREPLAPVERRRAGSGHRAGASSSARLLGGARAASGSPGLTRALVVPGASRSATVLEVRASDRRGLLYDLGNALARNGFAVRSAHIATYAGQALDTFYLTQADGSLLTPAQVGRVVALLIETADGSG